jgi:NAD(P)-dependent dehydrogenase (short-subunit alcohol dehydrogenase family)
MNVAGRVVLVTGANRGLGAVLARVLVEAGAARVYGGARDPASVADPEVHAIALDVTDPHQVLAAARALPEVDLVVNNAGVACAGAALTAPSDDARRQMEVNYFGLLSVSRAFAPALIAGRGGLANMLSVGSWVSSMRMAGYGASKAAAWSITNAIRLELRPHGVLVTALHVGQVATDMTAGLEGDKLEPRVVADALVAGLLADEEEILVGDRAREVKAAVGGDLALLYPR